MTAVDLTRSKKPAETAGADENEAASAGLNWIAFLRALRRRWLLTAFLGLAVTALAASGIWYGLPPPKHVANAALHVSSVAPSIITPMGSYGAEFAIYQQSQKALLTSRMVLTAALRQPKVNELSIVRKQSDPIDWLQKELKIDFKSGPEYMRLSLSGDEPEELTVLLTAITEAYLHEVVNREHNKQVTHLEHLKDIQARYETALQRKRKSIKEMSMAVGSANPEVLAVKHKYASEAVGEATKELIKLRSELRRLQLDLTVQAQKEKDPGTVEIPAALVEKEIQKDSILIQEMARKSALEKYLSDVVPQYRRGKDEPTLEPFFRELKSIQDGIDGRREKLKVVIAGQLREQSIRETKLALGQLRERESYMKALEKQLEVEIEAMQKQTKKMNVGQLDLEEFRQEIAQAEKIADQVRAKAELLGVELLAPARVTLVEAAYLTQDDPTKRKMKVAGLASPVVLLAVMGMVGWFEYRKRRIETASEVQDELGIRLLGTIPALTGPRRGPGGVRDQAYRSRQGIMTECVDGARTRLIHVTNLESVRVLLVTSAVPHEGKTTLSSNLAVSLARAGKRTLLVDGDLRLPCLHNLFDVAGEPGLAEILRGEITEADAIRPTYVENLSLLPAGQADLWAIQALARGPLHTLIPRLREQYDYVIIDSAPLLPVVDSLLIAQLADGVVLSVLQGESRVPLVQAANRRLTELNVRVLGAVVNGADMKSVYGTWYGCGYGKVYAEAVQGTPDAGTA